MCGMPRFLPRAESSISEPKVRFGNSVYSAQHLSDFAEILLVIFSSWLDVVDQRSIINFTFTLVWETGYQETRVHGNFTAYTKITMGCFLKMSIPGLNPDLLNEN